MAGECCHGNQFSIDEGEESTNEEERLPDGKWLAFVTKREASAIEPRAIEKKEEGKDAEHDAGKPAEHQIWLISPEGGEAWQLTKSERDIEGFHWSLDSKSIAFTAQLPERKLTKIAKKNTGTTMCSKRIMSSNSYG
jgi:Tol biopolymer transport system component